MTLAEIRSLFSSPEFSPLSRQFADFMLKLSGSDDPDFYLACGLVNHRAEQGDVCLDLLDFAGKSVLRSQGSQSTNSQAPSLESWVETLRHIPDIGVPGERKPLILDADGDVPRLYLLRYWQYEQRLADYIHRNRQLPPPTLDIPLLGEGIRRLFSMDPPQPDQQADAARAALQNRFCVITGGPGTGKTTTVLKIIILLLEQVADRPMTLAIAAPTGKAANRLGESIRSSRIEADQQGLTTQKVLSRIPEETFTIHRLLGSIRHSPRFRHDRTNPLPYDCIIVDEVSMVDMALMSKLIEALRPDSRLILLGDKNQLSSVESGSVLGDICEVPERSTHQNIINLEKSYRFNEQSGIGRLSHLINNGLARESLKMLHQPPSTDINWQPAPRPGDVRTSLEEALLKTYRHWFDTISTENVFSMVTRFGVLCALRNGPYGAATINRLIELMLTEKKLIPKNREWYIGRPVMITRNHHQLELYNGDIGIVLPDNEDNDRPKVFFDRGENVYRKISPARMPEHETAYAMTIHKSQGSEFDRVLIILPDQDAPILSRELIYTAITRARESVDIWSNDDTFLKSVNRRTERSSGLRSALYENLT
jgi:exodeoxyribonuclease V alpha subunit